MKYSYDKTITIDGRDYVFYKGYWWEDVIINDYERCNDSAEETLKDMYEDTYYNNSVCVSHYDDKSIMRYIYD